MKIIIRNSKYAPNVCFLCAVLLLFFVISPIIMRPASADPSLGANTIVHDIRPGRGITQITWLSEWFPPLKGTPADTRVFIADSGKAGATIFIAGGTHANEIAGIVTAVLFIENALPASGKLIVIPNINMSASTWTESSVVPSWIRLDTPQGPRFLSMALDIPMVYTKAHPILFAMSIQRVETLSTVLRLAISIASILAKQREHSPNSLPGQ